MCVFVFQNHMMANKIDAGLWLTRMCTVIASILFILPVFGLVITACYECSVPSVKHLYTGFTQVLEIT